jgi:23S rRNA pseudouridine2605 synthase
VLANAGVASRRACEELIAQGRVTVDGEVVTTPGTKVDPAEADVRVDGERVRSRPKLTFAVHKPRGVVSTTSDNDRAPKVVDLVARETEDRLYPIGRLDKESDGLMLLTNDGALAQRLMHPRYGILKTYRVRVAGEVSAADVTAMEEGIWTSDGKLRARSVQVIAEKKKARTGPKRKGAAIAAPGTTLQVVLAAGKNRQLRRMLAKLGKKVRRLTRTAIGPIRLGTLKSGACRRLTPEELDALTQTSASKGRKKAKAASAEPTPGARKPVKKTGARKPVKKTGTRKPVKKTDTRKPIKKTGVRKPRPTAKPRKKTGKRPKPKRPR